MTDPVPRPKARPAFILRPQRIGQIVLTCLLIYAILVVVDFWLAPFLPH